MNWRISWPITVMVAAGFPPMVLNGGKHVGILEFLARNALTSFLLKVGESAAATNSGVLPVMRATSASVHPGAGSPASPAAAVITGELITSASGSRF